MEGLLKITDLHVYHGVIQALRNINIEVNSKEIISIIGANGAGKTTLLKTISGLLRPLKGEVRFMGESIHKLEPYVIVKMGIIHVKEGRGIFPSLTVLENLLMGAYQRKDGEIEKEIKKVFQIFPWIEDRKSQPAGNLSGGMQQMLAISRGLMGKPSLLMLDEPSLGLSPLIVQEIMKVIKNLREEGIAILMVEQNARQALRICDRGYVLKDGEVVLSGVGIELLLGKGNLIKSYLGGKEVII